MPTKIEISHKTIVFTVLLLAGVWLTFQIREILLALFVALILMSALNPYIRSLEKRKIPRWLAILFIYILILSVLGLGLGGIVPPLVNQTTKLIESLPSFFQQFKGIGIDEKVIAGQISTFTSIPANIIKFVGGFFSNLVAMIALAMITFYLLLERKNSLKHFTSFFGHKWATKAEGILDEVELRIGGWVRGEILLMLLIGLFSYIGYTIIGIDYAIPLAILAFMFEIVPNIGPVLSAVPAVLVGLIISPLHALAVIGWCVLIQQVENTVLVPRVMKQVAGVNPLVSILSLAVGFKLAGVGGAVLAIPTYITFRVLFEKLSNLHASQD